MDPKKENYRHLADTLIKRFEKRRMNALYCETREEARKKVMEMIPKGATIGVGGSVTLTECGIMDDIRSSDYAFIDRFSAGTPKEIKDVTARTAVADYFLMSTNAFTKDGELVNIDGRGNRLAFFIYGPEHVIVVTGMNKMAPDVPSAIDRVRSIASPPNCVRLERKTPCSVTGLCGDCLGDESICSQIVVTRRSHIPGRITVVLVGEELGF